MTYSLVVEEHDGGYLAYFPALRGCHTKGKTYQHAVRYAEEALALYLDTLMVHRDLIPEETDIKKLVSLGIKVRAPVIA